MEYKKKNSRGDRSDRIIFTGIGMACLFGLFVLVYLFFFVYVGCGCSLPPATDSNQTTTFIAATVDPVTILIEQTHIGATEPAGTAWP